MTMRSTTVTAGLAERLEDAKRILANARNAIMTAARDSLVAQWKAAGGCERCYGWERVVTWSTLDGASWTEYGPCDKCTAESRAVGKAPASRWWGGYHAAGLDPLPSLPANAHAADVARVATLTQALALFEAAEAAERVRTDIRKGRAVEVVKGRKVPIGTRGVVFWIGDGQYGERCGIKDATGKVHWTACTNVEVQGAGRWPDVSPAMLAQLTAIYAELSEGRTLQGPIAFALPNGAPAQAPAPAPAQLAPSRACVLEVDSTDKPRTDDTPTRLLDVERFRKLEID